MRGLFTEGNLRFKIDWASPIVQENLPFFYFVFEGNFKVQGPRGLIFGGGIKGGLFAFRVWGAFIWRGLYMEGLIFGILRYFSKMLMVNFHPQMWGCLVGYYSKSPRLRPCNFPS